MLYSGRTLLVSAFDLCLEMTTYREIFHLKLSCRAMCEGLRFIMKKGALNCNLLFSSCNFKLEHDEV